jgi:translation initiation factor IF-3
VKVNKAREFLAKKDKVTLSILFRGREMAHINEGEKLLASVMAML